MNSLADVLDRYYSGHDDNKKTLSPTEQAGVAGTLRECLEEYQKTHSFRRGQLVEFKPRMDSSKLFNGVGIVHEVLDEPVINSTAESGSCYFRERLDVKVGVINSGGEYVVYHYESSRLQPYTGPLPETI